MRTVVVRLRRQPRRVTKRCTELYETAQPRSERSSWMRVNRSRSEVTQGSICSAHGASISSLGTSVVLGRDYWPRISILHPWPTTRFAVRTQGRSRMH